MCSSLLFSFSSSFLYILLHVTAVLGQTCSVRSDECAKIVESVDDKQYSAFLTLIRDALEATSPALEEGLVFQEQIAADLRPWSQLGVQRELLNSAKAHGVLYQVIDGQVYRQENCMFPARCAGVDYYLKKISANLSDTEFVVNFHDWPQVPTHGRSLQDQPPVFSFSKSPQTHSDILYPAWSFHCGGPALDLYPTGVGEWDKMRHRIAASASDWDSKEEVAFFRGSRTSSERDELILMSRRHSDLIDAQYTKNQAWRSLADTLGREPAATVSFESQCKYKYLLNMKGVAASFRYKHLFLCKSVVLNVESDWIEFFYPTLRPWVHYVPVASDLSDLLLKLHFLKENDSIAREIADRGFHFVWNHLTPESVPFYWQQLLLQYTNLLKYPIRPERTLLRIS